jgi:hypothetical protein
MRAWWGAVLAVGLIAVPSASAGCIDWEAEGPYADIDAASDVFEGVVARIDQGDVATCVPERVVFTVIRQWKGDPAKEIALLQDNGGQLIEKNPEGRITGRGCPVWSEADRFGEVGKHYIVFASRATGQLKAMGCGTSKPPSRHERRRLAKWQEKQKAVK